MAIYDISPPLHPGMPVWPGDVPFSRKESLRIAAGDSVNLSSLECSLHVGAHADAPSHCVAEGKTIDQSDLNVYIGRALLVTLSGESGAISSDELRLALEAGPERLLIRAHSGLDPGAFPGEIRYFAREAALKLGEAGVRLVGTDAPSVDPLDSKDLPAHRLFGRFGVAILENLWLREIPDGIYELIALPLSIAGAEASPVRAVLRTIELT